MDLVIESAIETLVDESLVDDAQRKYYRDVLKRVILEGKTITDALAKAPKVSVIKQEKNDAQRKYYRDNLNCSNRSPKGLFCSHKLRIGSLRSWGRLEVSHNFCEKRGSPCTPSHPWHTDLF